MRQFSIGNTDFGIDSDKSYLEVRKRNDGATLLTIEVKGSQPTFEDLTQADDSAWSWALYPPYFYLRRYKVPENAALGLPATTLSEADYDDHDIALYMMEHNNVSNVVIEISAGLLMVSGDLDLLGHPEKFCISWVTAPKG